MLEFLLHTLRQHQDVVPRRQQCHHSVHLWFPVRADEKTPPKTQRKCLEKEKQRDGQMVELLLSVLPPIFRHASFLCNESQIGTANAGPRSTCEDWMDLSLSVSWSAFISELWWTCPVWGSHNLICHRLLNPNVRWMIDTSLVSELCPD